MTLSSLWDRPFTALVRMELITALRRRRSVAWLLVFMLACVVVMVAGWPSERNFGAVIYQARNLYWFLAISVLCACVVLIPGLAGSAIVYEKDRETFELLKLTLIRPFGLYLGKAVNCAGFFILFIIMSLPVFASVLFLVGIDTAAIVQSSIVVFSTLIVCTCIGLFFSAWRRRSGQAIVQSYFITAFLLGGFMIPCGLLAVFLEECGFDVDWMGYLIERVSPIVCPIATLFLMVDGQIGSETVVVGATYNLVLAVIFAFLSILVLRRPVPEDNVDSHAAIDDPRILRKRKMRFPFYMIDPLRRKKEIEDGRNPVYVREFRCGMGNRSTLYIRLFYVSLILCLAVGLFGFYFTHVSTNEILVLFIFQMCAILWFLPAFTANLFTKEYEQGNMDMLRMTLLSPREVVLGKHRIGMLSMLPMTLATVITNIPYCFLYPESLLPFACGYTTLLVCGYLSTALSIWTSFYAKKTGNSVILGYFHSLFVFVGFVMLLAVIDWLVPWELLSDSLAFYWSPIMAYVYAVEEYAHGGEYVQFWTYWGSNTLLYFGLGWLVLRGAMRAYRRRLSED